MQNIATRERWQPDSRLPTHGTAADREFWLDRERQWMKFATYYEHSERLTAFIGELRSAPKQPICSACDVLMGVRRLDCRSDGSTEYHYECLACEAKQTVVEY